jgi:hypothetical protein
MRYEIACPWSYRKRLEVVRWANHVREAVRFEMHYVGSPERAEANAVFLARWVMWPWKLKSQLRE